MVTPEAHAIQEAVSPLFKHDERLRAVEVKIAALDTLPEAINRLEARLVSAIEANKPKPIWPAIAAMTALFGVAMAFFAALYGVPSQ